MLNEKHILVIGASSGIGIDLAKKILENNATVTLTYNSNNCFEGLQNEYGDKIKEIIQLDVTNKESLDSIINKFSEIQFDGVVNCNGINIGGPLISLDENQIQEQLKINLDSCIHLTKACLKQMIRKRSGSIVHMSSVSAHRMARGHSIYTAAKAGLEGFSKAMASEVAKRGIRLNTISPGPVMTEMLKKSIEQNGDDPKSRVPMNRLIETSEIADAAVFLLSDKSSAITGVNLPVDGGYTLW